MHHYIVHIFGPFWIFHAHLFYCFVLVFFPFFKFCFGSRLKLAVILFVGVKYFQLCAMSWYSSMHAALAVAKD